MSSRGAKWLKAGGIFVASLTAATILGFGLASVFPGEQCGFSVLMTVEEVDGVLRAEVTGVDGEYRVDQVVYRVLRRDDASFHVVTEGELSAAIAGDGGIVYHQQDPTAPFLMQGDYLLAEGIDGTDVMLLTLTGTPLGWTAGCEA